MSERAGRYDRLARKRSTRRQRETGVSVYIASEELRKAGYEPGVPLPWYRVWGTTRGRLIVQLYPEP